MTTGGKTLLLILGVLVMIVMCGLAGLFLIARRFEDPERYAVKRAEGREFGKAIDQRGCMTEALKRSKNINLLSMDENVDNELFLEGCLVTSRPVPGFCEGVPQWWNLKGSEWKQAQCERASQDPARTGCLMVFSQQIEYCNDQ